MLMRDTRWQYSIFRDLKTADDCFVACAITLIALSRLELMQPTEGGLDDETYIYRRGATIFRPESLSERLLGNAESRGLSKRSLKRFQSYSADLLNKWTEDDCRKWIETYTTGIIEYIDDTILDRPEMNWLDL